MDASVPTIDRLRVVPTETTEALIARIDERTLHQASTMSILLATQASSNAELADLRVRIAGINTEVQMGFTNVNNAIAATQAAPRWFYVSVSVAALVAAGAYAGHLFL
jgi:hypothetical protein